ncbi:hypothetical protein D3C81_07230 [compost metagenome]
MCKVNVCMAERVLVNEIDEEGNKWGSVQRYKLTSVLWKNGVSVSDSMWCLLVLNIKELIKEVGGKVWYIPNHEYTEKLNEFIIKNNTIIADNFDYIVSLTV